MRIARKLALLAAMALAATALMASTASANVTVIDEASGESCDTASCTLHATGEAKLSGHAFGFESTVADCVTEFGGTVDGSGEGSINTAGLTNHAGSNACDFIACDLPWAAHANESAGQVSLTVEFCVDESGTQRRCLVSLPVSEVLAHDYESVFQSQDISGTNHGNATNCELEGELHLEGTDIELVH